MSNHRKVLNVPNTLSLIRVAMVPIFLAASLYMQDLGIWGHLVPAFLFALAAFTDMLDGKIARKYNLITDFGKFLDPLADKFMVFGALLAILMTDPDIAPVFVWVAAVVIFRELAITSIRLVIAGSSGKVLPAKFWGKLKTCTQIAAIIVIFVEPVFVGYDIALFDYRICSYVMMGLMAIATVGSGISYMKSYIPMIDFNK